LNNIQIAVRLRFPVIRNTDPSCDLVQVLGGIGCVGSFYYNAQLSCGNHCLCMLCLLKAHTFYREIGKIHGTEIYCGLLNTE